VFDVPARSGPFPADRTVTGPGPGPHPPRSPALPLTDAARGVVSRVD